MTDQEYEDTITIEDIKEVLNEAESLKEK